MIGFHGAGDSAANFFNTMAYTGWDAAAAPDRFALLVPDTLSPHGDFAIWSGNPNNDMDEMLAELDSVLDLVHELADHAHLDLQRVHVCGTADSFYSYAQQSEAFLAGQGHPTRLDAIGGAGHQFSSLMAATTPDQVWSWVGAHALP